MPLLLGDGADLIHECQRLGEVFEFKAPFKATFIVDTPPDVELRQHLVGFCPFQWRHMTAAGYAFIVSQTQKDLPSIHKQQVKIYACQISGFGTFIV